MEDLGLDPAPIVTRPLPHQSEPAVGLVPDEASIIVPAHNEQATIAACLDAVLASTFQVKTPNLDIVVVANGCSDRTTEIVQGYGDSVRLIETSIGSKANALELGRKATRPGPRIYLDADIVVSADAIESVLARLGEEGIEGSAPAIDLARPPSTSLALREYARIWEQAPYFRADLIGAGFYGLTEQAQQRIGSWPALIADDLVALCHLLPEERRTASGWFRHTLPGRLRDVAKVEVRREAGRLEFAAWAEAEGRPLSEESPGGRWLIHLAKTPLNWPGLALFVGVKALAKVRARRAFSRNDIDWGQDQHGRKLRAGQG